MSENRSEAKSCLRKIRYRSEKSAKTQLLKLILKFGPGHPMHVYPCLFCGGWHIGRKSLNQLKKEMKCLYCGASWIDRFEELCVFDSKFGGVYDTSKWL